ncbi:hypothetical protein Clacol_002101 [Clathrus columnatus]|uniref:Cytochrome P450 n=1 Tax=Clathrus columnatus TaxID=1419009 RepID=A0AAV5A4F6_9AGAM|nr:hypothetical protein Clacol_002101 [Clathrus columnatus]
MPAEILLPIAVAFLWAEYLRRRKYKPPKGDIVSINLFGIPVIFVYSDEIVRELFEKRGALYSDRYPSSMAWLSGLKWNIGLIHYGDWWRRHARAFHQCFNSRAVLSYEGIKTKESRQLLRNLLESPDDFSEHLKFSVGRIIMDVVYAIDIKEEGGSFMNSVHTAIEGFGFTLVPGLWLVDVFPIFKHIPDWIPGIPFKKFVKKYKKPTEDTANVPFDIVKRLRRLENPLPNEEVVIKNVAGTAYIAGASTTYASGLQAILASVLYPETQKKLHDELDEVLGDRLPTLADRKNLPYVDAFLCEVMRWRPSVPFGVPRGLPENDPVNQVLLLLNRHILRDKKYGPNPEDFNPERFFEPGVRHPTEHFGFGRRTCPGRFFADNTLFLFVASIFKVFNIVPKKDENGNDIPISGRYAESFLPVPDPFQCSFKPRSPSAKELIIVDYTSDSLSL